MKLKSVGSEQFKLMDSILPSLSNGKYKARLSQSVAIGEGADQTVDTFQKETEFCAVGRAFTLQPDSVFSVYPTENANGNFSNELPFMVLNLKTLPWQYDCGGKPPCPWLALIVLSAFDEAEEQDISIEELLSKRDGELFYPSKKQPQFYLEEPDELCHVVDLPKEVYEKIMPGEEERSYLCHAKYVNLAKTEENVSCQDGYFSVIMGNRFIPSKETEAMKSTVHLVSLLGYDKADLSGYKKIRLCSLYHWNIFSQSSKEAGFGALVREIGCKQFGKEEGKNELQKRGVVAKEHRFRTGETTASLYCSPLLPAKAPALSMESRHTADGHMIYDKEKGVFDVKYACAWQLGRMISLSDESMAQKIHNWRKTRASKAHNQLLRKSITEAQPNFGVLCKNMKDLLGKGECKG